LFEMPGPQGTGSRIAVVEAKHGNTLGSLESTRYGRQGSWNWIVTSKNSYTESPGADKALAARVQAAMDAQTLDSYAVLRGAERVAKFDLQQFRSTGNLKANRYFEMKSVPRPPRKP
jgi:hypothetical protein